MWPWFATAAFVLLVVFSGAPMVAVVVGGAAVLLWVLGGER